MSLTAPGTYVLYREPGFNSLPWPAIVYVDDIAPVAIQKQRPNGYFTLILLIDKSYEFRWATTSELSLFKHLSEQESSLCDAKLREAYTTAASMAGAQIGTMEWREGVDLHYADQSVIEDDSSVDEELSIALQMSYKDINDNCATTKKHIVQNGDDSFEDSDDLYLVPPKIKNRPRSRLTETSTSMVNRPLLPACPAVDTRSRLQAEPAASHKGSGTHPPLDFLSAFGRTSGAHTSDVIDGELSNSREMVQIFVGSSSEPLTVPKSIVWDCTCFRDPRSGINYFQLNDQGMWVLQHPKLPEIAPDDFEPVLEYLSGGSFGHRSPEGQVQIAEAVVQCLVTWMVADQLDMHDLLDVIIEKMQNLIAPWPALEIILFARQLYAPGSVTLPAHDKLKALLADYLSEHYWECVLDQDTGFDFLGCLQKLPELELDIQARRFPTIQPDLGFMGDLTDDD